MSRLLLESPLLTIIYVDTLTCIIICCTGVVGLATSSIDGRVFGDNILLLTGDSLRVVVCSSLGFFSAIGDTILELNLCDPIGVLALPIGVAPSTDAGVLAENLLLRGNIRLKLEGDIVLSARNPGAIC